jgi:hypothetical protein
MSVPESLVEGFAYHEDMTRVFQFCMFGGLVIITRGLGQIWVQAIEESIMALEPCYILVTCYKLWSTSVYFYYRAM